MSQDAHDQSLEDSGPGFARSVFCDDFYGAQPPQRTRTHCAKRQRIKFIVFENSRLELCREGHQHLLCVLTGCCATSEGDNER